ncbi:MAG: hypothetical protein PHQ34_01615 [Methanothrix sp.]|nr:hypothetical protein [Methanothrix sp.]
MRQVLWFALMPLTAFWVYSLDIYSSSTDRNLAILSIFAGMIISIIGLLNEEAAICRSLALTALPAGIACFFIPYPYNAGLILIALALITYLLRPNSKALWLGMLSSGAILSIQALTIYIYYILAPSFHSLVSLSTVLSFILKIIGIDAAPKDGLIFIYGLEKIFPFTVSAEKLGIYPWLVIFAGAVFLVFISSRDFANASQRILKIFLVSIIYMILRCVFLISVFLATDMPQYASTRMDIFTEPNWLLFSFLPLIIILYVRYPINDLEIDFNLNIDKKTSACFILIFLSAFLILAAFIYQDPGIEKNGNVLVDEIHSIWEFSTLKLDENWYGESSTYNSYSLVEWLKDSYHVDRIVGPSYENWSVSGATKVVPDLKSDKITYNILKNYDILIIKTPTLYEPDEIDAVVRFVQEGGGLLLIGDHTNFGGSATSLNQIAKRFGIEFGFDAVNTQEGRLYYFNRGLMPHICLRYTPYLDFMTGCSIKAPLDAEPVILGFGLNAIPGEYSSTGFFRETRQNDPTQVTDTYWGLFYQAVALNYGRGRIVAFSDSTIISNFRVFFGGTSNFIIGIMEYLNHSNNLVQEKLILFTLGILMGILTIYLMMIWGVGKRRRFAVLTIIILICALSASLSIWLFSVPSESTVPGRFYSADHTVCFDGAHSSQIVGLGDTQGVYETFFVWTQRLGLTPTVESNFDESLKKGTILVIIDPVKPFTSQERQALFKYVEDGNRVILLTNSEGNGEYISNMFNMSAYLMNQDTYMENNDYDNMGLPIVPWGLNITGGDPLLNMSDRVVLSKADFGRGRFVLFTDSQIFKDGFNANPGYMGYSGTDPDFMSNLKYNLSNLYNLEYYIFDVVRAKNLSVKQTPYLV